MMNRSCTIAGVADDEQKLQVWQMVNRSCTIAGVAVASTQAPFTRAQGGGGCGKRAWYPLSAHASKFHGIP